MQQAPMGGGGSFLGTAAAAAAGVIGGSLLKGGIRSAMGGHPSPSPDAGTLDCLSGRAGSSPWSGNAADSDLARDAGLGDIRGSRDSGAFGATSQADQKADDDADADEADDVADDSYDGDGDSEEV